MRTIPDDSTVRVEAGPAEGPAASAYWGLIGFSLALATLLALGSYQWREVHASEVEPQPSLTIGKTADGRVVVRLSGTAGKGYRVEASSDFESWTSSHAARAELRAEDGTAGFNYTNDAPAGFRFYRALEISIDPISTVPPPTPPGPGLPPGSRVKPRLPPGGF